MAWTGGVCIDGQCLVLAELFGSCTSYHKIPKFVALLRVFRPVARKLCVGRFSIALSSQQRPKILKGSCLSPIVGLRFPSRGAFVTTGRQRSMG